MFFYRLMDGTPKRREFCPLITNLENYRDLRDSEIILLNFIMVQICTLYDIAFLSHNVHCHLKIEKYNYHNSIQKIAYVRTAGNLHPRNFLPVY